MTVSKKRDVSNRVSKARERGRQPGVQEQAAAYGVSLPQQPTDSERFLSPNDIGKIMNVTGEAVKQWIYHRRLPAVKLANGYWKVKVLDFEQFLKARNEVGRRRVLLTDTNASDLKGILTVIENLGHQALVAHNYSDALLKASDHHPALFVISLSAKESDPWKLVERLRAIKALKNVPILLLADSELSEKESEKALELGAQGFLTRPLNLETLSSEVKRILDRNL